MILITFEAFLQTSFAEEGNLIEPEVDPRHDPPVQDLMYQVIVDVDDHDYNDPHCIQEQLKLICMQDSEVAESTRIEVFQVPALIYFKQYIHFLCEEI